MSNLTIWEMERYLIEKGYKSDYSIDDLDKELKLLKNKWYKVVQHPYIGKYGYYNAHKFKSQ